MNEKEREEPVEKENASSTPPEENKGVGKRRVLRVAAWSAAGLLALCTVAGGGGLLFLRSSAGEAWLTRTVNEALHTLPGGLSAGIESVHGPLPSRILLSGISLRDEQGVWLEATKAELRMDWSSLPATLTVAELSLEEPRLLRLPETAPSPDTPEAAAPMTALQMQNTIKELFQNWPGWLPDFQVSSLSIRRATFADEILGSALQASLNASASLGKSGAAASLTLSRDDMTCEPVDVHASLSPELTLDLNAKGSDLGFAALLPDDTGKGLSGTFQLTGKGNPQLISTSLSAVLQEREMGNSLLDTSVEAAFNLTEERPVAMLRSMLVTMESGPASSRLWALAGQKSGSLKVRFNAVPLEDAENGLEFSTSVEFADMVWNSPELSAAFGKNCTLNSTGTVSLNAGNLLSAELKDLTLKAERLQALLRGSLHLTDGQPLSPDSHMNLHAECAFENTGAVIPELSGNVRFAGDVSGPLSALNSSASLSSNRLKFGETLLEKAKAELTIPQADIPRLLGEVPHVVENMRRGLFGSGAEEKSGSPAADPPTVEKAVLLLPLLTGRAKADLFINGQKTGLDALWTLEEKNTAQGTTLRAALDKLDIRLEGNSAKGSLEALFPLSPSSRNEGTTSAWLGMTPPALDGTLNISVQHWAPVSRVSGMRFSGSPLTLDLKLSSAKTQSLKSQVNLASLRIRSHQERISLSSLKTDIDIKDLWGRPDINLSANLEKLKTSSLALNGLALTAKGGQKGIQVSLQSNGDIRCDTAVRWKTGEYTLERLQAEVTPAFLGLSGDTPVGIRLLSPASVRQKEDSISVPGLSLALLPSGNADLSGTWSPKKLSLAAGIHDVDLAAFQTFSQEIPSGTLELQASAAGTISRPTGNLKLNLKNIQLPGSSLPPVDADLTGTLGMAGKRRTLSLSLTLPEATRTALGLTSCDVQASIPFTSPSHGVSLPDFRGPLRGDILLSGELGQLWKLVPLADQRLSGRVNLNASLAGTLSAPELTLHTALDDGRFADLAQGVELRDIRVRVDGDRLNIVRKSGSRLTLEFSAADSRKGSIAVNGWFDPTDMQLSINGNIDHLSPLRRQDVTIMLTGSLGVDGSIDDPSVRADITVDKGQIQLADLPGSDIVTLPIDEPGTKSAPAPKPMKGTLNVRVRIPNQFFIRGYGLECEWKGDIRARGPLARPGIIGNIQAVRGGLDVLGKHFDLAEGRISFDGGWPVSPMLNIIMEYTASNITADVTVSGSATKPEISLSSQPTMPQDEIISQIMFGQSAGTLSHVQAIQLAAGAAQLAGLGGPDVMGFGRKLLGLDVLKLNSESTNPDDGNSDMSKTSLEMGTYVLDNVYVGVEQGIGRESETDAVVEIELTPSLEAQAKASSQRTEFGLEWKKNY